MSQPRLEDLYVVHSGPVEITDGKTSITVVARKLNDVEHETMVRRGAAARARVIRHRTDPESEVYLAALDMVLQLGDDRMSLGSFVARQELGEGAISIRERMASETRWSKDDYLVGLLELWEAGLEDLWGDAERGNADKDDPRVVEAYSVFEALREFEAAVSAEIEALRGEVMARFDGADLDKLRHEAVQSIIAEAGEKEWYEEIIRARIWLGTRVYQPVLGVDPSDDPELDLSHQYFESRQQVDEIHPLVRRKLSEVFKGMDASGLAGKDSPAPAGSSQPSEPLPGSAESSSSGPRTAVG